ncbi:MAG: hydroxyneurosporene dehydrogenase [Ruminococcaceae bacterium]|nr:hydroxyneurosporene dehydrogenase [Oscillospiraceae bacterium]
MKKIRAAIHPDDDFHYEKLGISRNKIELWEDAMRTDGSRGTYEWWYFDSSYSDGTKLIIFFFSKSPIEVDGPVKPMSTIELTLPDGRKFEEQVNASIEDSFYSREKCDIKIGDCRMEGDLKEYSIVFKGKTMSARVSLVNTVPAWRSQCGPILFGDKEEYFFNWLPATPEGKVEADVSFSEGQLHLEGSGYHDHNWGNISMLKLMHHWYWGRAKIGDYKVISSWITAEKKYGYKDFDVFMLAKGGEILGDNANHTLKFLPEDEYTDSHTGKPVYNKVVYEYETPAGEFYRIAYKRRGDISRQNFIDLLPAPVRLGAKLIGFEGSYLRFEGSATIERLENGIAVESVTEDSAVWELMYFGKACADKLYKEKNL